MLAEAGGGGEALEYGGSIGGIRLGRGERCGQGNEMAWSLPGQVEFSLQVLLCNLEVAQSHVGRAMAKQLHQRRQADTGTQHSRGVGVAHLVWHDVSGDSGLQGGIRESRTKLGAQHAAAVGTRQQELRGSRGRQGT